jgi:hypothetical protein
VIHDEWQNVQSAAKLRDYARKQDFKHDNEEAARIIHRQRFDKHL